MGEWRRPATGRARRAGRHCDVRLRDILRVERGREGKLDIGRADLQRVLLTSILWPVNRGALCESVIRPPLSPPPRCPYHIILLVSVDVWLPSLLYNDPSM